ATKAAVVAFQKSKGLITDGIVGERTWTELNLT
ncbi:peptidoglycan-binding domain-containing protein, partial [Allocoleopsis sp.]